MTSLAWIVETILTMVLCGVVTAQTWRSSSEYVVLDCPNGISVPTDMGRSWARVTWVEPRFINPDGVEVLPARISHNPGERFPVGSHNIRYSLVDGNHKVTCSFMVRVDDEEPPRIVNCPSDITVPADPGSTSRSSVSWDVPLATDNFRVKHFSSSNPIGSSFSVGYTGVTYTAVDLKGNQAECTFNVIVTADDESPILEGCPVEALTYVPPTANSGPVSWTPPRGIDNAGPPRITCTRSRGESFPLGRTEVVYTATDAAGNSATCTFNAVVKVEIPGNKIFLRNHTSTELEISWPQHVNQKASSYLIYIWPVGTSQPQASDHQYHPINWRESFTTHTLRGLSPGTIYNIRIYVTGVGDELDAKLRTKPNAPSDFTLKAESLDSTSVFLMWQPPVGNFDQYQISYQATGSETMTTLRLLDKGIVKKHVTELYPNTSYVFTLVSVSGVRNSKSQSDPATLNATTAPLPKSQILLQKVTATSIQMVARLVPATTTQTPTAYDRGSSQSRLNRHGTGAVRPEVEDEGDDYHHSNGYVIVIYSNNSDVSTDVIFESGTLQYEFMALVPTTLYTIRIIPSDASGNVLEKTTMTCPSTVTDLVLQEVTNSSVTIAWSPPSGRYERYKVTYAPMKLEDAAPTTVAGNEVTIDGLVPMTTYVVSVVTIYEALTSEPADIQVTPGVDKAEALLTLDEPTCTSPILASCFLAAILVFIGIYICRLKMCYKYMNIHRRHTEENTYENPTRPNSEYLSSPPYQNTEGSETMAMLLRSHPPPISVSGYMYPPIARGLFSRGKRTSSASKGNGSAISPIYYNVKEADS